MKSDAGASARQTLAWMLGVGVLAAAAFLPVLATGFTSDDFFILSRVRALNGTENPLAYFQLSFFGNYRPLVFLSHAVDWEIWKLDPFGYHLRSLTLHAFCSVLVFLIGRRFLNQTLAAVAGALFALHPASHEVVYWMSGRFDLMATTFMLVAVWCLSDDRPVWRAVGVLSFGLAMLSKESAISLVLIAPAWDVFIGRRSFRDVIRRAIPLMLVVGVYAIARSFGADLEAAGGARRLPKIVMAMALMGAILAVAWRRDHPSERASDRASDHARRWWAGWPGVGAAAVLLAGLLVLPASSGALQSLLGFAAYAAFYLVSPVVFPSPPAWVFTPIEWQDALIGLGVAVGLVALAVRYGRLIAAHGEASFLVVFVAAALLPVSSMAGGLRYLYLATAGVTLFAGWLLTRAHRRARLVASLAITIIIVVSLQQLMVAGRRWRAGAEMQRAGITLMAGAIQPCGTRDVVLLTTPTGVGGIYANFLFEAFDVLTDCSPKNFLTLLRVVGSDAHVDVTSTSDREVELRVPSYAGNIMASEDLSTFHERITPGRQLVLETAIGRLETFPDGTTQVFRIALTPSAQSAARFYYSDGSIHAVKNDLGSRFR